MDSELEEKALFSLSVSWIMPHILLCLSTFITDHCFSLGVFQNPCPIVVCILTFWGSWCKYLCLCLLLLTDHGTLICCAKFLNSCLSPRHIDIRDKCKANAIPWFVMKYLSHALPRFLFVSVFKIYIHIYK